MTSVPKSAGASTCAGGVPWNRVADRGPWCRRPAAIGGSGVPWLQQTSSDSDFTSGEDKTDARDYRSTGHSPKCAGMPRRRPGARASAFSVSAGAAAARVQRRPEDGREGPDVGGGEVVAGPVDGDVADGHGAPVDRADPGREVDQRGARRGCRLALGGQAAAAPRRAPGRRRTGSARAGGGPCRRRGRWATPGCRPAPRPARRRPAAASSGRPGRPPARPGWRASPSQADAAYPEVSRRSGGSARSRSMTRRFHSSQAG